MTKRPRIGIVLPNLEAGGAERAMLRLADGLAQDGLRVDLVVGDARGALRESVPESVTLVDLGRPRVRGAISPLARYLRSARPAAVLSALAHLNVAVVAAVALSRTRPRVVVSERSTRSSYIAFDGSTFDRLLDPVSRIVYARTDAIVTVSKGAADDLARRLWFRRERITVLSNPIIGDDLSAQADVAVTHPWFAPGDRPVVLSAGRLAPVKGYDILIRGFARLREEIPCRLMILGEGGQRASLEALAADCGLTADDIAMPGFVANPYPYMKHAAVFVLSSHVEGMPNVLVEAAALGTPVVATDCPSGPSEILDGGRHGPLVLPGDAVGLAGAMEEQLRDPRRVPTEALDAFRVESAVAAYRRILLP